MIRCGRNVSVGSITSITASSSTCGNFPMSHSVSGYKASFTCRYFYLSFTQNVKVAQCVFLILYCHCTMKYKFSYSWWWHYEMPSPKYNTCLSQKWFIVPLKNDSVLLLFLRLDHFSFSRRQWLCIYDWYRFDLAFYWPL